MPAPAQTGMNCVLDRLAPQERRELGDALLANAPMSDKDEALLDRINGDCTGQLGLTDPEKGDALIGVLSSLIVERSGAALTDVGIPPAVIDAWFDGQSDDLRSDLERPVPDTETDARIDSLLATMEKNGAQPRRQDSRRTWSFSTSVRAPFSIGWNTGSASASISRRPTESRPSKIGMGMTGSPVHVPLPDQASTSPARRCTSMAPWR